MAHPAGKSGQGKDRGTNPAFPGRTPPAAQELDPPALPVAGWRGPGGPVYFI